MLNRYGWWLRVQNFKSISSKMTALESFHIYMLQTVTYVIFGISKKKYFVQFWKFKSVLGIFFVYLNTSPGEGLRITRPGEGGIFCPPAISVPRNARNTKLEGWVGPHKNSFWCKFGDPRSTSSRSNDVINAKFSHFLVKRAALCFSRSCTQTKTDSFDL